MHEQTRQTIFKWSPINHHPERILHIPPLNTQFEPYNYINSPRNVESLDFWNLVGNLTKTHEQNMSLEHALNIIFVHVTRNVVTGRESLDIEIRSHTKTLHW